MFLNDVDRFLWKTPVPDDIGPLADSSRRVRRISEFNGTYRAKTVNSMVPMRIDITVRKGSSI